MDSTYPLISTKIRTPRLRQNLLHRERLVDFVHGHIHQKLILVAAAAGYGKTSLLIDYAHDTDLPVCWYSLDASDCDLVTFVQYLIHAIQQRFPHFGQEIAQEIRDLAVRGEDVELLVRLLVHELESAIQQYFVLVLDDYHEVIESEWVNALLDGLLRYLPESCHLVLASRGVPRRLTLTRLAARQEVVGLGQEDLRFTAEEIRALLRQLGSVDLTEEQVHVLAERTEGWITGVLLAAQANWGGTARDILRITGSTGGVFAYMAEEIMARQPPELQRFLWGSALFEEMTPPLCDALLDMGNSGQILRELTERNLFTFPLDAEGNWYQYHQLFREFLIASFEREDPGGYRSLRLKQAQVMAHRGNWSRAADSYLVAGAWAEAADAIEVVAQDTFDAGRWAVLRAWIDALPEAALAQHPRLLFFRARVHAEMGELTQSSLLFDRARQLYLKRGDEVGAARAMVQDSAVLRLKGRLREALGACESVLQMIGERDLFTAMHAHHNIAICYALQGRTTDGSSELEKALHLAERSADEINAAYIEHDMGVVATMRGQLMEARHHYRRALIYWRKVGNASALASTLQSLGVVHHHLGQYTEAQDRFQEALAKAKDVADSRIEAYALTSQGDLYRDMGRYDDALHVYHLALEIATAGQATRLVIYLLDALGNACRLKGDPSQAKQWIVEATSQVHEEEMAYEAGLCALSRGILALQQVQVDTAQTELQRARDLFAFGEAKRELGRTYLYLAACAQARGDEAQMATYLEQVAHVAGEHGSQQFIVAEAPSVGGLLRYAQEHAVPGLDYVHIRSELEHLALAAPTATWPFVLMGSTDMDAGGTMLPAPPQIEFAALNGSLVLKDQQVVSSWESAAARNMAFLFATYPKGLTRDKVIELLWPEVNPARGNSLFHSSMYRLRSALCKDIILHARGVYRVNPAISWQYDVVAFQRLAELGQGADEAAHIARQQAISIYHTPFLEGCDSDWCLALRQALQQKMIDALIVEGQYLAETGAFHHAESCFLRALGHDSFDERAHRGVMWCRAGDSDRAGALRQYRECTRILMQELDVDPSPETTAMYQAILAGKPPPRPT